MSNRTHAHAVLAVGPPYTRIVFKTVKNARPASKRGDNRNIDLMPD